MRVLVVEDNVRMSALLRRGLTEEGYAVDVTGDGREAVWLGTENRYDAIVLDLMLPSLDGISVCRELRASGQWAPILLLTARDAVETRIDGLDAGADDFLAKPFAFGELAARLRALLRRGSRERPHVLQLDDLLLDPASHRSWRGERELTLSSKEFGLLELFLRHPDEVLSRARILEHLWDFAFEANSNIVDQYVRYLRLKVDTPFKRDNLQTVRGAGYRLTRTAAWHAD